MRWAIAAAVLIIGVGTASGQVGEFRITPRALGQGAPTMNGNPGSSPNALPLTPYQAAPSYCWIELRVYQTLRHGPVDFCRQKLKYTPGRLECFQITDQVCAVLQSDGTWIDTRSVVSRQVFACPPGPEPPVCRRLDVS